MAMGLDIFVGEEIHKGTTRKVLKSKLVEFFKPRSTPRRIFSAIGFVNIWFIVLRRITCKNETGKSGTFSYSARDK